MEGFFGETELQFEPHWDATSLLPNSPLLQTETSSALPSYTALPEPQLTVTPTVSNNTPTAAVQPTPTLTASPALAVAGLAPTIAPPMDPVQLGGMIQSIKSSIGQLHKALSESEGSKVGGSRKRKAAEIDLDAISDEEEKKKIQRKQRNKQSAQESRDKKKSRMLVLESSVTLLSTNNTLLENQLQTSQQENDALKERLRQAEALLKQHNINTSVLTPMPNSTSTTTTPTINVHNTTHNVTNNFNGPQQTQGTPVPTAPTTPYQFAFPSTAPATTQQGAWTPPNTQMLEKTKPTMTQRYVLLLFHAVLGIVIFTLGSWILVAHGN
eukprot:TRINITY_DN58259_c0_g1_i2.p1 TRINITY_DN58259_c0_g1~~TRINITY_DN58259_c0_g1_i2.p1  ORF type:complete len:354 (-),score=40.12 TRINITY_DN58259_c0_g1_i2:271-1248(-)